MARLSRNYHSRGDVNVNLEFQVRGSYAPDNNCQHLTSSAGQLPVVPLSRSIDFSMEEGMQLSGSSPGIRDCDVESMQITKKPSRFCTSRAFQLQHTGGRKQTRQQSSTAGSDNHGLDN
jgi:hypothetical protein